MVLWGSGERLFVFDVEEAQHCEKCGMDRNFQLRLKYRYGHFYHLFGWVIEREYQLACPHCEHGWILNTRAAEERLGGDPVPFHQRHGWIVLIVLTVLIGVAAAAYRNGP